MTSVRVLEDQFVLNTLSIDPDTGVLTLPSGSQHLVPDKIAKDAAEIAYAAPLCTSRDGTEVYVLFPAEQVYALVLINSLLRGQISFKLNHDDPLQ